MKTKRLFIFLVSLFSLALAACSTHFTTEIKADGSGEFEVRFALTEEDIKAIEEEEGDDFEDLLFDEFGDDDIQNACEELVDENDFPRNATATYSENGGEFSCEISMAFDDLDELIEIYEDLFFGMTGKIRMNADGELSYMIDLSESDFASENDFGVGEIEYLWIVTAPGSIENHNADQERKGTLTWELDAQDTESIEFDSVPAGLFSGLTGSSSALWVLGFALLCLCAVVLVLGSGVALYVYIQNKKNAEEI
jgi:hypothetical protein